MTEETIKGIDGIPMFSWNTEKKEFYVLGQKFDDVNSIEDFINYITELQQENKILKAKLEIGKTCGFCPYYDYKSRCKKANEYVNFVINHYKEQLETPIEDTYFDSDVNRKGYILSIIAYLQIILDTLIGSDENEY